MIEDLLILLVTCSLLLTLFTTMTLSIIFNFYIYKKCNKYESNFVQINKLLRDMDMDIVYLKSLDVRYSIIESKPNDT